MANMELSEQEIIRRESLAKLRELGIEPYPAPLYPVNTSTKEILEGYETHVPVNTHTTKVACFQFFRNWITYLPYSS